jgi:probable addiction module antidote protein
MKFTTKPFDAADYLKNNEVRSFYLTEALETHDPRLIMRALGAIARSKGGITQLSRLTGLTREGLHRALGEDGNPEFATVVKVLDALGFTLTASARKQKKAVARGSSLRRKPVARAVTAKPKASHRKAA